jgi:ABC-type transporter Mla MlaB component
VPFTSPCMPPGAGGGHFTDGARDGVRVAVKIDTRGASAVTLSVRWVTMRTTTVDGQPAAHACAVPGSDEQLWEMTAAFLAAGLAVGEQVVYLDDGTADSVLERLVDDRVPVRGPLANGQLTVVEAEQTRTVFHAPVRDTAVLLATMIDDAVGEGYAGFRMTGQFSSGLVRTDGLHLADYDGVLDSVLAGRPARVLCLYDRHRYPDDAIARLRAMHHIELDAPALYDDNLLRITRTAPFRLRLAGEIDHSNRPTVLRLVATTLDEALRSHSSPAALEFDLSSLRVLDVAGAVGLVHAAEGFPETHRLGLHGVRPGVLRVLDRCGAPFAAQLDVTAHPGDLPGGPR